MKKYLSKYTINFDMNMRGHKMLQISNLTIKYGKRVILDNQNISFRKGQITGIKGKSGAGKSSLLNVLGLIKTPNQECRYEYEGREIDIFSDTNNSLFRMNHIGFIFQQGNLMKNLSAVENVILPQLMCEIDESKIDQKASEWIKYVELEPVKNSYPEDLSGGEEQRIAIARALINESDIILADEPTASLDAENSKKIMQLLKKLAHELNKIVIVVSHDEETISYSDLIYEIKDSKLNLVKESKEQKKSLEIHNDLNKGKLKEKTICSFIRRYEKLRRKEYNLNRVLILITAVVVAMASLSAGFGDTFTNKQKNFINSISDRSLLVINDTLGINATADYEDAIAFEKGTLEYIQGIPNVDNVFPFYTFTSYGMTADIENKASVRVLRDDYDVLVEREYENTYVADGNEFSVSAVFEEENVSNFLLDGSSKQLGDEAVYLTYTMAKDITNNPEELIGKSIEIYCYVPTKLYISEATKPKSKADIEKGVEDEVVEIDGCVSKLVKIEKIIGGVLNNSYENDKSTNSDKIILMNYREMLKILDQNKESLGSQTFPGFEEKELAPSMLVVYVTNFDDVANVEEKISNYSSTISVINRAGDVEETRNNLEGIKYTMLIISIILIIVVTIMFSLLYYFKNRDRKKEVGVLKALGLSQKDVLRLIGIDMVKNTLLAFIISIIFSVMAQWIFNMVFGVEVVSVSVISIILSFAISVVTVFMSGMVSVWKTSKIDVIDAIRLNK